MFESGQPLASHECAKCRGGCCKNSSRTIFINFHEIKRIHDATGLPIKFFAEYARLSKSFQKDFKSAQGEQFLNEGDKSTFLRFVDGKCVFLGRKGCSLPHSLKSTVCRGFPLWYWHFPSGRNKIYLPEGIDTCLIFQKFKDGKNLGRLMREMNESRPGLLKLFRRYEEEKEVFIRFKALLDEMPLETVIDHLATSKII